MIVILRASMLEPCLWLFCWYYIYYICNDTPCTKITQWFLQF